jgi:hypothetical protein
METGTFKLKHSVSLPLTKELAAEHRDLPASPTERELNPQRLKHLREKVDHGVFIACHWATAELGGKKIRMNGQHSSTMLCELNGAFPSDLFAHIDHYEVADSDGLALLFRQFDDRKSSRSAADVAGAYQMIHAALHGVARPTAKLGVEGVQWYRRYVEGLPALPGDDVYTLFTHTGLHEFLIWLNEVLSIKTPELKRAQVVAAMYATFITSATDARKFWADVARGGDEYDDTAPASVLDRWLKRIKEGEIEDVQPAQFFQGSIYAWNALREAKTLKDIKSDTKKGMHSPV